MQFRIISFTVAIALLSAMSACGPNKKRTDALDRARSKAAEAAAQAGGNSPTLEKALLGADLPNLADGRALLQNNCPNPINLEIPASEKEITPQAREALTEGSVFELVSAKMHGEAHLKTGETGTISGTITGPLPATDKRADLDNAAVVSCHTSAAAAGAGKNVAPTELTLSIPAQISAQANESSSVALVNVQAREGKVAGRVTLLPQALTVDALLAAAATDTAADKASLSSDAEQNLHYRLQHTTTQDGTTLVWTIEAIYAKRK